MSWSRPPAPRTHLDPEGRTIWTWLPRVLSEALRVRLLTVAPGAPAGPTRPDSTRGSHSVQQMPLFIFMCFQKSERSETQLGYKIQHKMRFIPISHKKQKIFQKSFCQNQLVDPTFHPSRPKHLPQAQALAHLGPGRRDRPRSALRMTGGDRTPWPPGLTNQQRFPHTVLRTPTLPETATETSLAGGAIRWGVMLCGQGQGVGQEASWPRLRQGTTLHAVILSGRVETPSFSHCPSNKG